METSLNQRLRNLQRRLLAIGLGAALTWALAAAIVVLVLCMWLDLALDLMPVPRIICAVGCAAAALFLAGRLAIAVWRHAAPTAMARRLDAAAGAKGQILSGVDLLLRPATAGAGGSTLTAGMARLAVDRAARLAAGVSAPAAAPASPIVHPLMALGLLGTFVLTMSLAAPRLAFTQWTRFFDPFGDHPPYSRLEFDVTPGNTNVIYGSSLDIHAVPRGENVENMELVVRGGKDAAEESLPMFPEPGGAWRATLTNLSTASQYFVRALGTRSQHFSIGIITVPRIEATRFRITPPAYTHRPPIEGPLPAGGLTVLPGTTVQVWAKSNRPLSGGTIQSTAPQALPDFLLSTQPVVINGHSGLGRIDTVCSSFGLQPTESGASEATGTLVIRSAGTLSVKVSDVNGQSSSDSVTVPVTLLRDERPFVRILSPKPDSYATPEITLDVEMLAEDDFGVARLELFRSLNDSRAMPLNIPVPNSQPTRFPVTVPLPLSAYGVSPGDVVKLYARVEDNDPAGPKGSESPVVTIQIISAEQMRQMMVTQQGLEVLLSKYAQANRQMESANQRIDMLHKEMEKADPDSQVAKDLQEKIRKEAEHVAQGAEELAGLSAENLPFDLDQALKHQLDAAAQAMEKAADSLNTLGTKPGLSAGAAAQGLAEAQKQLGQERKDFKEEAADPLDHMAAIYPLIEDEARYLDLWQRQKDLADRMDSLSGHDNEDNPQLKSRMRDLEQEQRQLRDDLRDLLDDIDARTARLPADPKLDDLRKTAGDFSKAVRGSAVAGKMSASESGLADFAGTASAKASREAAEEMEKFIGKCNSMGGEGQACLKFQPKLSAALGDTVQQLLEAAGLGAKPGPKGMGGTGGYSQRRNSMRNVGLYGRLPNRKQGRGGGSQADHGVADDNQGGVNPERRPGGGADRLDASGQSDAVVPARYKRRVGEYFQRVADELDSQRK